MKAFECPKYEILVGLKIEICLVAQNAIMLGNTQTDDDDDDERERLEWMTTHSWMM